MLAHFEIFGEGLGPAFLALELADQGQKVTWIRKKEADSQISVQRAAPIVWGKLKRIFIRHNLLVREIENTPRQKGWIFLNPKKPDYSQVEYDRDWHSDENFRWIFSSTLEGHLYDLCFLRGVGFSDSLSTSSKTATVRIDFRPPKTKEASPKKETLHLQVYLRPLQNLALQNPRQEFLVFCHLNGVQILSEPHPGGGWILNLRGDSAHQIEKELEFCFSKNGPAYFQGLGLGSLSQSPRYWRHESAFAPKSSFEIDGDTVGLGRFWGRHSSVFHSDLHFDFLSIERFLKFQSRLMRFNDWVEMNREIKRFNEQELNFSRDFALRSRISQSLVLNFPFLRKFVPAFSPQRRAEFPSPI